MNKLMMYFFIAVLACSCKQEETVIPPDVIPYDAMVQVLSDVQQSEVAILFLRNKADTILPKPEELYKYIFDTYKISGDEFDKSFKFYASETQLMEKLYGDVIEELRKRQVELEGVN